jgi:plastocyanin
MHLARRAAAGVAAITAAFALAACSPQDNGNNTLAGTKSPGVQGGPQTTAPAEAGAPLTVDAKDNAFAPKTIAAKAGDITITVKNTGAAPHTFTSAELNADQAIDPGKETSITLTGVKAGTYKFVCKYHETLGMTGEITVT